MKKKQKERLAELFRLIKENPDLPILPMVDSEVVAWMHIPVPYDGE